MCFWSWSSWLRQPRESSNFKYIVTTTGTTKDKNAQCCFYRFGIKEMYFLRIHLSAQNTIKQHDVKFCQAFEWKEPKDFLPTLRFLYDHVYMLILIPVSWMIFAITDIKEAILYIKRMFAFPIKEVVQLNGAELLNEYISNYWWLFLICIVCATPLPMKLIDKFYKNYVVKAVLLVLFWICIYQLITSGENPFLYFRF